MQDICSWFSKGLAVSLDDFTFIARNKSANDWYLDIYAPASSGNEQSSEHISTFYAHHFSSLEDAAKFCVDIAEGNIAIEQVKKDAALAWQRITQKIQHKAQSDAEMEFKQFLTHAKSLGIKPEVLPSLMFSYNTLGDMARRMVCDRQNYLAAEENQKIFVFQTQDNTFCMFEGEANPHVFRGNIRNIEAGDAFLVGEGLLFAEDASHQNHDEPDEPWIVYDDDGNGWFEEDLGTTEDLLLLSNVSRVDQHIDAFALNNIVRSAETKIRDELSVNSDEPFIDVCAEISFPEGFYPGHTLVVWGEENDADDRFYSVSIYKNDHTGAPSEQLRSVMSERDSITDLSGTISSILIQFDEAQRVNSKTSVPLMDQIKSAKARTAQQLPEQSSATEIDFDRN